MCPNNANCCNTTFPADLSSLLNVLSGDSCLKKTAQLDHKFAPAYLEVFVNKIWINLSYGLLSEYQPPALVCSSPYFNSISGLLTLGGLVSLLQMWRSRTLGNLIALVEADGENQDSSLAPGSMPPFLPVVAHGCSSLWVWVEVKEKFREVQTQEMGNIQIIDSIPNTADNVQPANACLVLARWELVRFLPQPWFHLRQHQEGCPVDTQEHNR